MVVSVSCPAEVGVLVFLQHGSMPADRQPRIAAPPGCQSDMLPDDTPLKERLNGTHRTMASHNDSFGRGFALVISVVCMCANRAARFGFR